jgi:hypothetical protein
MSSEELSDHDLVKKKFLLIPEYYKVKSHFQESKSGRTPHKLSISSAEKILLKLIQKIKDKSFSYGVKTKWMKFKSNDSLLVQTQEIYTFKFFPNSCL